MIRTEIMQAQAKDRGSTPVPGGAHVERMALLYQGVLTAIVRIQAGRQELFDPVSFQKRMEGLLDEIEREALKANYDKKDINEGHYVTIAFLDEAVSRSDDPNKKLWSPLAVKRYEDGKAGEGVFDRLKALRSKRGDSAALADLLEIYSLCFLLGFEGRYATEGRSDLDFLMEDLREQIDRIRGFDPKLSPHGALPAEPEGPLPRKVPLGRWKMIALVCAATAVLSWIILKAILVAYGQGAANEILAP